jgi:hypothetical protein
MDFSRDDVPYASRFLSFSMQMSMVMSWVVPLKLMQMWYLQRRRARMGCQ